MSVSSVTFDCINLILQAVALVGDVFDLLLQVLDVLVRSAQRAIGIPGAVINDNCLAVLRTGLETH